MAKLRKRTQALPQSTRALHTSTRAGASSKAAPTPLASTSRSIEGLAPRKRTATPPAHNTRPRMGPLGNIAATAGFGDHDERKLIRPRVQLDIDRAVNAGTMKHVEIAGHAGKLKGLFHPPSGEFASKKIVLFLSGSGEPVESLGLDIADEYQKRGIGVLTVNYRGFGGSEGEPTEEGLYQDARSMLDHLLASQELQAQDADIVVHGFSMGGPIAARLVGDLHAEGRSIGGLILDRPMPSISKAFAAHAWPGLGKVTGQFAKHALGTMSVEKNLQALRQGTKIYLTTDSSALGTPGEALRERLQGQGFEVLGSNLEVDHLDNRFAFKKQIGGLRKHFFDAVHKGISHVSRPSVEKAADDDLLHPTGEGSSRRRSHLGHRRAQLSIDSRPEAVPDAVDVMDPVADTLRQLEGRLPSTSGGPAGRDSAEDQEDGPDTSSRTPPRPQASASRHGTAPVGGTSSPQEAPAGLSDQATFDDIIAYLRDW